MACPKKRPWDPLFTLKIFWMGDVGVDLNSVDLGTNSSDHQDNIFNIFLPTGNLGLNLHFLTATKWGGRIQAIQFPGVLTWCGCRVHVHCAKTPMLLNFCVT